MTQLQTESVVRKKKMVHFVAVRGIAAVLTNWYPFLLKIHPDVTNKNRSVVEATAKGEWIVIAGKEFPKSRLSAVVKNLLNFNRSFRDKNIFIQLVRVLFFQIEIDMKKFRIKELNQTRKSDVKSSFITRFGWSRHKKGEIMALNLSALNLLSNGASRLVRKWVLIGARISKLYMKTRTLLKRLKEGILSLINSVINCEILYL